MEDLRDIRVTEGQLETIQCEVGLQQAAEFFRLCLTK